MSQEYKLLIVDDESANLQKLKRTFISDFKVLEAQSGEEALDLLKREPIAAIITDQRMPGMTGVDLLKESLSLNPDTARIILTGFTQVEDMMDAINKGHVHRYITKPWEPISLRQAVTQELERWQLKRENKRLNSELRKANVKLETENVKLKEEVQLLKNTGQSLIYRSRPMHDLLRMLDRVVKTGATVLMQGETGTGKELIARYIHDNSDRSQQAFVPVNCGAIPSDLVESAFFGHQKGSFTGATANKKGYFELADRGTLFLDEIGEAPLELQVKLLRVLQENEIYPVGAQSPRKVDVRVIGSTNRNLSRMVEEGGFRQDLFFRLNVFSVLVPPLRARREDVQILADFFLSRFSERLNKEVSGFLPETLEILESYSWPGNVRELENEIERMVILADSKQVLGTEFLSERIRFRSDPARATDNLKEQVAALERQLIIESLRVHRNNRSHAAKALGVSRQTIISKIKEYHLS